MNEIWRLYPQSFSRLSICCQGVSIPLCQSEPMNRSQAYNVWNATNEWKKWWKLWCRDLVRTAPFILHAWKVTGIFRPSVEQITAVECRHPCVAGITVGRTMAGLKLQLSIECKFLNREKRKEEPTRYQLCVLKLTESVGWTNEKWPYRIIAESTHEISSDKLHRIDVLWRNVGIPFTKAVLKDREAQVVRPMAVETVLCSIENLVLWRYTFIVTQSTCYVHFPRGHQTQATV